MTAAPSRLRAARRPVLLAVVGFGVSAAGLWAVLQGVDPQQTIEALVRMTLAPLLLAGVAIAVQLWLRSLRWSTLLSVRPVLVPSRRLLPVLLVGYLANAVLPARLGDPLRGVMAARREHVPVAAGLGSVALERIIDTLTLALLALPAVALTNAPGWLLRTAVVAAALAATVLILLQTGLPAKVLGALRRRDPSERGMAEGWNPWIDRGLTLLVALNISRRRRSFALAVALSVGAWLLDGTVYWCAAAALGQGLSPAAAMLISAITVLGTAIPSAPGYLGVFELVASTMAQALGVPAESALAFAIVAHALSVLPLAFGGIASLVWIGTPQVRAASRVATA